MKQTQPRKKEAGFTLITVALGAIVLVGLVGLAVDIGRMFIAKSESQAFVDSASLAATLELDGTMSGLERARNAASNNPNKWNFNTGTFSNIKITFAKDRSGPWEEFPSTANGYKYANTTAEVEVPLSFLGIFKPVQSSPPAGVGWLQAVAPSLTAKVNADSSAGQELKTRFREGTFPFSPFAHNAEGPHYGLIPGQLYTIRWASMPRVDHNTCPGDNTQEMVDLAQSGGGDERGFIEETGASVIRDAIVADYQTVWRGIGDQVIMTGGAKQAELDALLTRIGQDTNSSAPNYTAYMSMGTGNGRRIVAAPVNTGAPDYRVVQIGAFLLLPTGNYGNGGNASWCAEYIGPWVQGTKNKGADEAGPHVVRLTK
jgi:hypothetical protein